MIKKITTIVTGLALVGILSVGLGSSFTYQAGHADLPAPARTDFAPAYEHGKTWISDGHTGGIVVADSHADLPAPQES